MENGSAVVSFGDGCWYGLTDSEILEVGPVSPCAAGEGGSYRIDPYSGISRDPKVAATAYKQAQAFGGFGGGLGGLGSTSAAIGGGAAGAGMSAAAISSSVLGGVAAVGGG